MPDDAVLLERLKAKRSRLAELKAIFGVLTKGERQIMCLAAAGLSRGEIARQLHITTNTVKTQKLKAVDKTMNTVGSARLLPVLALELQLLTELLA